MINFCLVRLLFFASWPRPESAISAERDLASGGLCLGEVPGELLSSALELGVSSPRITRRRLPVLQREAALPLFSAASSA